MKKSFLDCPLEIKLFSEDKDFFVFEGYASTFGNVDQGNDVVEKGAFIDAIATLQTKSVSIKDSDFKKLMPILWQHDQTRPIGAFVEIREDAKGLFVKGIMPIADTFVSGTVIPQMKVGSISDMSIGYSIVKRSFKGDVQHLEKLNLRETSLVTFPMNEEAHVTGFKSFDLPIADKSTVWDAQKAAERVEEKELVTIAGELIGDVIEGKLQLVPNAVFELAAKMADSGVDGDKKTIAAIYEKMGLESPYKESGAFRIDDIKSHSPRQLESLLKNGVCFSQKQAKTIISILNETEQRDVEQASQRDADIKEELEKLLKSFK